MRLRLVASVLALAFLAAGCFSSGLSVRQEAISLYSQSELIADGPALQQVTVRAYRGGEPVVPDGLQVMGRTADGSPVPVDWTPTAHVGGGADGAPEAGGPSAGALTFEVDVHDLVRRGAVELELALQESVLMLPIRPAAGSETDPAAGDVPGLVAGDDVDVEAELDESAAFQWDAGLEPDYGPELPYDPAADHALYDDLLQQDAGYEGTEGAATVAALAPARVTRQVRMLRRGTSQATPAYIIRSSNPGPTVVVVGGVHGSETAGWRAAEEIKDWTIDRGTLVVIPQANRPAVLRSRRTGPDGIDLNRQFPVNRPPRTALAREIWNLVREFRPVALMDLHEGWGLRRLGHRFPGGTLSVGQTLITYPARDARSFALYATRYVDARHVGPSRTYSFLNIGPPVAGSLARKAGAELNIPAFIVEPSQHRTNLTTRIRWHKAFVEQLLKWYGLVDRSRTLVAPLYRSSVPGSAGAGEPGDAWPLPERLPA